MYVHVGVCEVQAIAESFDTESIEERRGSNQLRRPSKFVRKGRDLIEDGLTDVMDDTNRARLGLIPSS
jgi:hypothetical protein